MTCPLEELTSSVRAHSRDVLAYEEALRNALDNVQQLHGCLENERTERLAAESQLDGLHTAMGYLQTQVHQLSEELEREQQRAARLAHSLAAFQDENAAPQRRQLRDATCMTVDLDDDSLLNATMTSLSSRTPLPAMENDAAAPLPPLRLDALRLISPRSAESSSRFLLVQESSRRPPDSARRPFDSARRPPDSARRPFDSARRPPDSARMLLMGADITVTPREDFALLEDTTTGRLVGSPRNVAAAVQTSLDYSDAQTSTTETYLPAPPGTFMESLGWVAAVVAIVLHILSHIKASINHHSNNNSNSS